MKFLLIAIILLHLLGVISGCSKDEQSQSHLVIDYDISVLIEDSEVIQN
ncbi:MULTISPECIES: hypothetical protein [unclassified Paenibacillus]|nr:MULTISPECIES: hypothetical protein [unclassified Paenibacillus]